MGRTLRDFNLSYLREKQGPKWHRPEVGRYHLSQLYRIARGLVKEEEFFNGKNFPDKTLLTMDIGTAIHKHQQEKFLPAELEEVVERWRRGDIDEDNLLKYLEKRSKVIERPVEMDYDDFKIVGKVDVVLKENKKEIPLELKTCSKIPGSPSKAYLYQVQGQIQGLDAPYGYLEYIEKVKQDFNSQTFEIDRDDYLWEDIVNRVAEFHEMLMTSKHPLAKQNGI